MGLLKSRNFREISALGTCWHLRKNMSFVLLFKEEIWVAWMIIFESVFEAVPLTASFALNFIESCQFSIALFSVASLDWILCILMSFRPLSHASFGYDVFCHYIINYLSSSILQDLETNRAFNHHFRANNLSGAFVGFFMLVFFAEFFAAVLTAQRKVANLVAIRVLASVFEIFEFHFFFVELVMSRKKKVAKFKYQHFL